MTEMQERRNLDARRVAVETLVEVCGGMRGFEAESVNISGTGMQVRTAYLPEEGAPLVCRFHDRGREVVVEGVVAWRKEGARGGEFGVRFTALDSRGVQALRELCGDVVEDDDGTSDDADDDAITAEHGLAAQAVGARVRLHIEGLGAPMKARVRDSSKKRVRVASKLEFLKVGRELELEDLEQGQRRTALIDGVDVSLDPATQIPQLVVALRFNDVDTTPDPSVVDTGTRRANGASPSHAGADQAGRSEKPSPRQHESTRERSDKGREAGRASTNGSDWEATDENASDTSAVRGRLASFALGAGAVTERAGKRFAKVSARAARELGGMLKAASSKLRNRVSDDAAPRRQTAPAPAGPLKIDGRRIPSPSPTLRPQSTSRAPAAASAVSDDRKPNRTPKRLGRAVAGAGAVAVLTALGMALWGKAEAPPGEPELEALRPPAVAVTAHPGTAPEVTTVVTKLDAAQPDPAPAPTAMVANVPLFGATPMATMEPAPLGAPPPLNDQSAAEEARERAAAALTRVEDEIWPKDKAEGEGATKGAGEAQAKKADNTPASPADVAPWGRGRMHLPTIHRLRLDAPGEAILGAMTPAGFSVVVPRRKVVEDGQGIKSRDNRIAKVRARNIGAGAEITFQFRADVPPYRVRLRKDFVEVLISAPVDKK